MKIIKSITKSRVIAEYYDKSLSNNWVGTEWEKYPLLDPKQKGGLGEVIVEEIMKGNKHTVTPPEDPGHDRIVDNKKVEIKFSLANSNSRKDGKLIDPDSFMFNHIAIGKNWDVFVFCGINPKKNNPNIRESDHTDWPEYRIYTMNKKDLVRHLSSGDPTPFRKQQGGKKASNDDWIVCGRDGCLQLFALPFVKEYKGVI